MRVRRLLWSVPVVVLALAAVPGAAAAGPSPATGCTISQLDEHKEWVWSFVTGADPTGRYILGYGWTDQAEDPAARYPVIWDNGVRTAVPIPGTRQQLEDVNSAGVAVGSSADPDTSEALSPWIYRNGRVRPLPGGVTGEARAINDRGDVAGNTAAGVAVRWSADATRPGPEKLPLPAGAASASAHDIDEDGTVVGTMWGKDGIGRGIVWRPGAKALLLQAPPGLGPTTRAVGIRNGWVTGSADTAAGEVVTVRWHLPGGAAGAYPQLFFSVGVNADGWLAGSSTAHAPLVVTDAGDMALPGLVEGAPVNGVAIDVSDGGHTVAGAVTDQRGVERAVRWRCG
ncbi:hypothetical protein ACTMTJ_40740 [Phytohabitans sp. LJ34]|uniref:hypothetical protein n=1 Tax=Phytohabitans sp. LJ34 TaxID=3452217 RepID=UPI003F8AC8ED